MKLIYSILALFAMAVPALAQDCNPSDRPIRTVNESGQTIFLPTNTDRGWCAWSAHGIDNPVFRPNSGDSTGNGDSSSSGSGGSNGGGDHGNY